MNKANQPEQRVHIGFRLLPSVVARLDELGRLEHRPRANMIETLVIRAYDEHMREEEEANDPND
jgi:hypothetical protein